ncbi:unnamed protein product, partial [Polarella glacialis]
EEAMQDDSTKVTPGVDQLQFTVKKAVAGAAAASFDVELGTSATVSELAARLATHEGCDVALITIVSRGLPLKDPTAKLQPLAEKEGPGNKVPVVYIVRKPAAAAAAPAAAPTPAASSSSSSASSSALPAATSAAAPAAPPAPAAAGGTPALGRRVLLLLRHGQCCHEGEHDTLKELTMHGHRQAEESARYVAQLFQEGKLPAKRALLHSTSRRASETAAKLPPLIPNLE